MSEDFEINFFNFSFEISFFVKIEKKSTIEISLARKRS